MTRNAFESTIPRRRTLDRRGVPLELEEHFMAGIVTLARMLRWEVHHEHDSRRSSSGWPDLELVRPPRHVRAECKVPEDGHEPEDELSPDQQRIIGKLRQCPGTETYVWGPRDWPEIQRILR